MPNVLDEEEQEVVLSSCRGGDRWLSGQSSSESERRQPSVSSIIAFGYSQCSATLYNSGTGGFPFIQHRVTKIGIVELDDFESVETKAKPATLTPGTASSTLQDPLLAECYP